VPPRRLRLDAELVRRGAARSRDHASELIAAGRVSVNGGVARKPATGVTTDADIVVRDDPDRPDYASRGGHKLAGALADFAALGLTVAQIGGPVDVVVGDLSFISLELVLDALLGVTRPDGDLALMVKPQFEVGRERLGKGGVVRDPAHRADAVEKVVVAAERRGWGAVAGTVSSLPGPSGNVEFFVWLRHGPRALTREAIDALAARSAERSAPGEKVIP
jgi:23S rRNA (cytidine1920-2'-O)/16S rRNA (cytidine1409-2'-O)-methyltransferase